MRCLFGYGIRSPADTTLPVQPGPVAAPAIADRLDQHQAPAALIVWVGLLGYRRSGNVVPDFDKHPRAIGG